VFDFDEGGCCPSAALNREENQNGGLNSGGDVNSKCRSYYFKDLSNTYHRYACLVSGSVKYWRVFCQSSEQIDHHDRDGSLDTARS